METIKIKSTFYGYDGKAYPAVYTIQKNKQSIITKNQRRVKMLLEDLTDEQLKKIAENRPDPDFMADYRTDWMADYRPAYSKKELPAEIEKIIT